MSWNKALKVHQILLMIEAGSVYKNAFEGDIYDVSDKNNGTHPVYRYGKPFFMGVR